MENGIYRKSEWGQAVEYGRHLYGVFPKAGEQMVTGLLSHDGNCFMSYIDDGKHKYPNWIQNYKQTPLSNALEAFIDGEVMAIEKSSVDNREHPELVLESAGMGGWRYEYKRKRNFRRQILKSEVDLETTAIINRYGEVYCPRVDISQVQSKYWEFIEREYEHTHSHHEATA